VRATWQKRPVATFWVSDSSGMGGETRLLTRVVVPFVASTPPQYVVRLHTAASGTSKSAGYGSEGARHSPAPSLQPEGAHALGNANGASRTLP
jgi:hypothetical protein